MELKIVIKGNPVVKKNTSKTSLFTKDKFGRRIPRDSPIHYYTQEYKEWAREAIQSCMVFRTKHPEITLPITEKVNVKCLFFMQSNKLVDISNLFQGVHDVITGHESWSNVPKDLYQIIYDDSCRYIGSVDGSRVLLDTINPRTEIIITNYIM